MQNARFIWHFSSHFFFLSLALLSFFFSHATRRVDWHRVLTPRQPISCPILLRCFSCFSCSPSSCFCVALHGYRFAVLAVCFLNPFIKGATAFFAVAVNMIFRLRFSLFKYPVVHAYRGHIAASVCKELLLLEWLYKILIRMLKIHFLSSLLLQVSTS